MNQAGIATLAVIVVLMATGVGTIGTPLIVDAVDVQPDSPLYSLERAGERIKGAFAGGQDWEIERAQERCSEFVYMVDIGNASEYTWLVEEANNHLFETAKLADDNEGLQKAIEANLRHLVLLENIKERVPVDAKPAISFAQLQSYASVGVLENVAMKVHLKIPEPLKIELDNRLSQIRVAIENMRIENVEPPEFTIRIENVWVENLRYENQQIRDIVIEGDGVQGNVISSVVYEAEEEILALAAETKYTVTVVIAADEEYRANNPAWRDRAEDALEDADDYFIGEYGLNFRTIRFEEYHSDDSLSDPIELFRDVLDKVDKKDANIMLAFSGQYQGEIMGGAEFRGDDVLIFPKSIRWPYNESEVIQHELSHLYNAKDHIPGLFDWCIMSYTWGGITTRGWCGTCHQRMEEYILNRAPLLAWTDEDVYSIGETIEINLKNESDRPLDIGSWWIERWGDGGWKRVYPSIWLAYSSEPRTVEPGEVRHLTWDQKVVMQMIRGTKENIYHLVRDQVLPGEYQIVWEPWDRERDETFGRAMSNFCITGTVLRVEPPSAVLGLGDTQTFRAKIVTYTKTDYVVFTETGVTENHLLPFGKRLLGGMFTETWVTENATWTLSDPTVGRIRIYELITIGPYSYVVFYAENAGTTTINASYQGYSDSSLIIVRPAEVVVPIPGEENAWVWTDKDVYLAGENITIYFKNRAEESLIFGVAPTWHIERYRADEWKLVRIYPPDMYWILLLTGIEPSEIKSSTWDQKIYIGSWENYEEIQAEPGRYRVVWSPENLETGEPVGEFKSEFRIANIIIYWPENEYTCTEEQESTLNDSGATPQTVAEVVDGNNKFAFDLYSQLAENNEKNVFFSPWSISTALAMTYEGARGQTAEEMESVLHIPGNDDVRRPSFAWIHNRLNENKEYELESANALWAQEDYPFLNSYFGIIQDYYGGKTANLDFINRTEEARETINDWVSEKTRGKIEELIEEDILDQFTRLVLTNAIYFKGEWVKQFNENATHQEDFWVGPGRTVEVPMMNLTGENAKFNYMETEELEAIEMPYKGEDLSMLILLPKTRFGLSDLEENINLSRLNEIRRGLKEQKVNVYIPKFEFNTKYELPKTLKEMGMVSAFLEGIANFSGMDGTRDLFIQSVIHEAFVKVDEKGAEAAAATGVGVGVGIAPPEKTFHADHPFMFIIQEKGTGNILFLGRVVNPSK